MVIFYQSHTRLPMITSSPPLELKLKFYFFILSTIFSFIGHSLHPFALNDLTLTMKSKAMKTKLNRPWQREIFKNKSLTSTNLRVLKENKQVCQHSCCRFPCLWYLFWTIYCNCKQSSRNSQKQKRKNSVTAIWNWNQISFKNSTRFPPRKHQTAINTA